MSNDINIRKATIADSNFLAQIILKAEETGAEMISYTKMFQKSTETLVPFIQKAIENDFEGHPFTYKSFYIATVNNTPSSAISAYVEGINGDSNHLITGALMSVFSREEMKHGFALIAQNKEIQIPKNKGVLQLDSIATLPEYRGMGLLRKLVEYVLAEYKMKTIKKAEIQVWKKNVTAISVYNKLGFEIVEERLSHLDNNNGKILMQKEI
jgi:ribosomal protein S18 acetylase RimI-like enzyme